MTHVYVQADCQVIEGPPVSYHINTISFSSETGLSLGGDSATIVVPLTINQNRLYTEIRHAIEQAVAVHDFVVDAIFTQDAATEI